MTRLRCCATAAVFVALSTSAVCADRATADTAPGSAMIVAPLRTVASPLRVDLERQSAFSGVAMPLRFDPAAYTALRDRQEAVIEGFPLAAASRGAAPRSVALELVRHDGAQANADFVVARIVDGAVVSASLPTPDVAIFRGRVVGDPGSFAYVAFSPHGTHGYVRTAGVTQIISPGPFNAGHAQMVYSIDALPPGVIRWRDFVCDTVTEDLQAWPAVQGGIAGEPACRRLEIAIETDKEFTDGLFGGNAEAASAYVATLLGASSEIFQREVNATLEVVFVRLWQDDDPWTGENTSQQLNEFRAHWNANMTGIGRHLAHFLSGRELGGGIAWLNAVCHPSNGYAVSANLNGFFPYPLEDNSSQNWDPVVVTHEFGHNVGTSHTHNFCPPLDQCASSQYYGQCQDERVCINNGTIMSYCHTCSGGLANIVLEFHPVVRQTIINYLGTVGQCYIGCVPPAPVVHVPQDTPSIQEAILAVMPGGEVIVAPGTYSETIRPFGKAAHIRSSAGPEVTIIDASGLDGSVARFSNGEGPTTILDGFTLTGGTGSSVSLGGSTNIVGGGVYIANASPVIVNCIISGNSASFGGGLFVNGSTPLIQQCVITGNSASPSSGGGVFNFSGAAPQFIDTLFEGNSAGANGGAMSNQASSPVVTNCVFDGNTASGSGGAVRNIQSSAAQFSGCEFRENVAGSMGGAFINDASPSTSIGSSAFCGNSPNDINGSYLNAGGNSFATACAVPGDLNGDGAVDGSDLGLLLQVWGTCASCAADLNGDGVVDGADLGLLLFNWS